MYGCNKFKSSEHTKRIIISFMRISMYTSSYRRNAQAISYIFMHTFMLEKEIKSFVLINYHYSDNYVFSIGFEEIHF